MESLRKSFLLQPAFFVLIFLIGFCGCTKEFVPVSGGTFVMGSPAAEIGHRDDEAQHPVTLTHDIEVMTKEVTQFEFESMMGHNPSFFPPLGSNPSLPAEQVSWFDALAYSIKKSEAEGLQACYELSDIACADGTLGDAVDFCKDNGGIASAGVSLNGVSSIHDCEGFRLPTEAEWEYVARGGTTTALFNGPIVNRGCSPLDPNLDTIAWYCANAGYVTHRGAKKKPNEWGVYDMNGNVAEWCWDGYQSDYPEVETDPVGPVESYFRTVRGGSVRFDGAARCRSAYRSGYSPGFRTRYVGFRLVRTLPSDKVNHTEPVRKVDAHGHSRTGEKTMARTGLGPAKSYPDSLPFDFVREDVGEPLTTEEIEAFTTKVTSFWNQIQYFHWILWHSHGIDASNPDGMPDYKLYWQDTQAIKNGDTVTFQHRGGADNLMIRTSKVLNNAAAGYLMSGDPTMERVVEQYCKGIVALFRGMQWDEQDPERYLMPRAIFTQENAYTEDGRQAYVDYAPVRHEVVNWNAHTINNPNNPYWGDIWVRNMRSKDDVPHIFRTVPLLMRVAQEGLTAEVLEAASTAVQYLQGFARDIVDSGYYIRTKDKQGNAYVPLNDNGFVNDLASFVTWEVFVPNGECTAKLVSAVIGFGDPMDNDCGNGIGGLYETIASLSHYFNWAIIRYFHAAVLTNALMAGLNDVAFELLQGMAGRVDAMMRGEGNWEDYREWDSDVAAYLLVAATAGLPLTSQEARHVMEQYSLAVDHYANWPNWDLWDPSVPDGEIEYKPSRDGEVDGVPVTVVRPTELTYLIEYCYSPFRNETGADLVDCDIIGDPDRWGE